jgi:hypothetical protein
MLLRRKSDGETKSTPLRCRLPDALMRELKERAVEGGYDSKSTSETIVLALMRTFREAAAATLGDGEQDTVDLLYKSVRRRVQSQLRPLS